MPTVPSRARRGRTVVALALLLGLTASTSAGCSLGGDDHDEAPPAAAPPPADVVAGLTETVEQRAEAVRNHDTGGLLAGLVAGDRELRSEQRTYAANLAQLPLGVFAYDLDPASVVRDGDGYLAVVELRTQLTGFDQRAVVSRDRMRFAPAGPDGHYAIASATDPEWQAAHDVRPQPWDLGPVVVRTVPGVLGVFDEGSVPAADRLLADVGQGISDVSAVVPYDWSRAVVVYALSDPAFLASVPELSGADPQVADGLAFPVAAEPGKPALASTRFVLNPRLLDQAGPDRSRLIRHELTHVALGRRDDHAPVWLSEGLAEYVSVQALPPEQRGISPSAIDAARVGFDDLPDDADFGGPASGAHYGESWWVCEYIAARYGEATLWSLLGHLGDLGAGEDPDRALETWVGIGPRQLARRAGRMLLGTFAPA